MSQCIYCGVQIPDGAKFCTSCGSAIPQDATSVQPYQTPEAQPYQTPAQTYQQPYDQQYQQPYQQQPYQQQPYQQAGASGKSATTLIILSVLEIIFLGGLLAIIPLVFSIQANSAYNAGDIVTGDAKAKTAKTALIVIAIVAVVLLVLVFIGAFAGASSSYSTR